MQRYIAFQNEDDISRRTEVVGTVESDHMGVDGQILKGRVQSETGPMAIHSKSAAEDSLEDGQVVMSIPDPAKVEQPTSTSGVIRLKIKNVTQHLIFRIFGLCLIIIDICVLIADLAQGHTHNERAYDVTALCFACFFLLEVSLRIFAKGPREFFTTWYNAIDFVVVTVTFIVTIICTVIDLNYDVSPYAKLVVIGRLIRIAAFFRLYTERKHLTKGARMVVSQNKRRYQKDGFDLDLTYVTERVIAMSFPSSGRMSLYRNPIKEVVRFLDTKHYNHYKVYNLCSERTYNDAFFHGRVERFFIDDHNVPVLQDLLKFVQNVHSWFSQDKENVIAVHCKGGKGRTGTMICVWLVEAGLFGSAEASLDYFGSRRTDLAVGSKFQGVETPSQNRYVGYFQLLKQKYSGQLPPAVSLRIRSIKIDAMAGIGKGDGSDFWCEIFQAKIKVFECHFGQNRNCKAEYQSEADHLEVMLFDCPVLTGDVKLKFSSSSKNVPCGYDDCPFYFWFHTSFIQDYRLQVPRDQLDNPHKPKTWNTFREKFAVELVFTSPDDPSC